MRFARSVRVLTLESRMASLLGGFCFAHNADEASSTVVMADVSPRMLISGVNQYFNSPWRLVQMKLGSHTRWSL